LTTSLNIGKGFLPYESLLAKVQNLSAGRAKGCVSAAPMLSERRPIMDWEFFIVQTLSGISFAAILFLLASGLSLIFGVMNIVNIAHGSYYMLGGYIIRTNRELHFGYPRRGISYRHNRIRDAAFLPSKIF
jgi:hypothetical protein